MDDQQLLLKMREQSWLTSARPRDLALRVSETTTERKWRLMGCAFGRACQPRITLPEVAEWLELSERHADSPLPEHELQRLAQTLIDHYYDRQTTSEASHCFAVMSDTLTMKRGRWDKHWLARILQVHRSRESRMLLCNLVRDIFGNPFRPVAFDPRWRSESTVSLARTAYDTRNFTLLPILADALEEAGCDHPDVLTHCRDPNGVHVRGCWVVDGVLGKT
jgi:hypothetical protein